MRLFRFPLPRLILVLFLLTALAAPASAATAARPASGSQPLVAEWLENVNLGKPSNRTTVVRIAALGMALALFIMFRSKH